MREVMRGPGRPREFDEADALGKIMKLFWENGYEGTSLADIMSATELRKASLYAAFGDKQAMYLKALARYHEENVRTASAALRGNGEPESRIHQFLSAPINAISAQNERRGCFLCNASADQAALSPDTAETVAHGFETMAKALAATLGEIHPDSSDQDLNAKAWMLLSVYSGLNIMARSGLPVETLQTARDAGMATI